MLDYFKGNSFICLCNNPAVYDPNQLYHWFQDFSQKNTLLEGTIPLDKNRPGFGWCDSKQHVMAPNSQCPPVSNRNIYQSILLSIWKVPCQMRDKTK